MSEPSSAMPRPVPPSADDIARTSASWPIMDPR
ncbi:hypothetical protein ACVILE_005746 [Streptomyces sp. M18.1]